MFMVVTIFRVIRRQDLYDFRGGPFRDKKGLNKMKVTMIMVSWRHNDLSRNCHTKGAVQ